MPTKRRKVGAIRIAGALTDRQRAELLVGYDPFCFGGTGIENDEHGRQLWQRHQAELLRDDSYNSTYPGRRPWAFWRYERALRPNMTGCPAIFTGRAASRASSTWCISCW